MRGKKILSIAVSAALALSMLPAQAVDAPADQLAGQWYEAAMTTAVERGIVGGDESGNLQPGRNITRGEMAVMLDRVMDYQAKADNKFGDLASGAYYTDAILAASAAGILKGDDLGNVKPGAGITRQETAVMLARVMGIEEMNAPSGNFADQSGIAPWAVKAVNAMKAAGYMGAQEVYFRPLDAITRAEVATVLSNIFAGYFNEARTYSGDVNGSAVVNTAGATLKNMKVTGDLIVAEGVAEGNLYLDGVTVGGRLLVRGGGVNSVYIRGASQVGNVIISRQDGPIRVVVEGGAKVEIVVVDDGSDAVKLEGTMGSVVIEGAAAVEVAGTVGTVTLDAPDASLKVSGTVAKVATTENAAGAVIEAAAGGKITAVEANGAGTQITGSGKVDSVSAKANDVSVATPNTKVEAAPGTSGVTAGGKPVAGGSTGGGGGYVPPSTAHIANVSNLTELTEALANTSKTIINITKDITGGNAPVKVERAVTINGGGKKLTFSGLEGIAADVTEDDGLIIYKTAAGTVVNNLIVDAGLGNGKDTWVGTYAIHVYNATNVTLKDVKATGGNGGILVNSSEVTLEGSVDVFDNGFGGIEVSRGEGLSQGGKLTVSGTVVNTTEEKGKPTAWVVNDLEGENKPQGEIVEGQVSFLKSSLKTEKKNQTLYYLMINVLDKAQKYSYGDGYKYTNEAAVSVDAEGKLTLSYVGESKDFNKVVTGTNNTRATMDLARFLGGLYRIEMGISEIKCDSKAYKWIEGMNLVGSNWAITDKSDTLVSAVVSELAPKSNDNLEDVLEAMEALLEGVTVSLELNGTPIDFVVKMELPSASEILEKAVEFEYKANTPGSNAYAYKGTFAVSGTAVTYASENKELGKDAMDDLARFLGAIFRFDGGMSLYKIVYNEKDYMWIVPEGGELKGSNWRELGSDVTQTLVNAIVNDLKAENPPEQLQLTINNETVTFAVKAENG